MGLQACGFHGRPPARATLFMLSSQMPFENGIWRGINDSFRPVLRWLVCNGRNERFPVYDPVCGYPRPGGCAWWGARKANLGLARPHVGRGKSPVPCGRTVGRVPRVRNLRAFSSRRLSGYPSARQIVTPAGGRPDLQSPLTPQTRKTARSGNRAWPRSVPPSSRARLLRGNGRRVRATARNSRRGPPFRGTAGGRLRR